MGILDRLLNKKPVNVSDINDAAAPLKPQQTKQKNRLKDVEITEEYNAIKTLIERGKQFLFVTGKAGTGKTTLIHFLNNVFEHKNVVTVAPTGVAALNAKGQTIHSFFKLPPRFVFPEDIKTVSNKRFYVDMHILIVDEISMVRADVIDGMNSFLQKARGNRKPFGGIQVIFLGDLFQLPPVINSSEGKMLSKHGYRSPYFFSAKSLQNAQLIPINLTKIYRQSDVHFINLLSNIRTGKDIQKTINKINKVCFNNSNFKTQITLSATNAVAESINTNKLKQINSKEVSYFGSMGGDFKERNLPSPMQLTLKVGAQVMMTQNQRDWVNGSLAKVVSLSDNTIKIKLLDKPGKIYQVDKARWETFKYVYDSDLGKISPKVSGWFEQYPIMIAWAITIHKSQGKTLDSVTINMGSGAFTTGQTYVALSRCKNLERINLLKEIKETDVRVDKNIINFYKSLEILN